MSDIVILIGGTGAKIMDSIVHMTACGMYGSRSMEVFFVDLENSNGNRMAAVSSFNYFKTCKNSLSLSGTTLFNGDINKLSPELWNPLGLRDDVTLDQYFARENMDEEPGKFFDTLFTSDERKVKLDKGCLGHQNIGAVVMADQMDLKTTEPWKTIWSRIEQAVNGADPEGVKVFVAGSVFGGTGAPGLSTIPKIIYQEMLDEYEQDPLKMKKISIGGFLALPYFAFDDFKSDKSLKASSKNFIHKTRQALDYYYQTESIKHYDSVYLAGNDVLARLAKPVEGGPEQRNEPHFVELLAALALDDFLMRPKSATTCNITAVKDKETLGWDDLPVSQEKKKLIIKMLRFAFAYSGMFRPVLLNIRNDKTKESDVPWYHSFFIKQGIKVGNRTVEDALESLDRYTKELLLWFTYLHISSKRGSSEQLQLVEYRYYSIEKTTEDKKIIWEILPEFNTGKFSNLVKGDTYNKDINNIWNKMCSFKSSQIGGDKVGSFVKALYGCID